MKRRANYEGTISEEKSKNGQKVYIARITVIDPIANKVRRIKRSGKTGKEALQRVNDYKADIESGFIPEKGRMLLKDWIETWLIDYKQDQVKAKTFEKYASNLRCYISAKIGQVPIQQLTGLFLQRHLKALLLCGREDKKGLSAYTVIQTRRNLISTLEMAKKLGYIKQNPARDTTRPKEQRNEIQTLSQEEVKQVLIKAQEHSPYALAVFLLALSTGMRLGEVFGLKWADINFQDNKISVLRSMSRTVMKGRVLEDTKTKSSRRTLLVDKKLIDVLNAHKKRQLEERDINHTDLDLVFENKFGSLRDTDNFNRRVFFRVLKAAGVERHITFHVLRHTHATLLLAKGISPKVVQERLGHSSITVTMDVYSHVTQDLQQSAVEALEEIW